MIYARTAFFEGDLNEAQKKEFVEYMRNTVAPIIRTFPGCLALQINVPYKLEPAAPKQLLLMVQHSYKDADAFTKAIDSEQRTASMNATNVMIEKFAVKVYHIDFYNDSI
jgi:quinol monooxygenase YgiN